MGMTKVTDSMLEDTGTMPAWDGSALTNLSAGNMVAGGAFPAIDGSALTGISAGGGGKVLQVVQTHDTTTRSQSVTISTVSNISGLNASITPSSTDSKILISVRWNGEGSSDHDHDLMFGIRRNSVEVGSAAPAGDRRHGIAHGAGSGYHGVNNTSTPTFVFYEYLDSPSTTSTITYHATVNPSLSYTLYTNRTGGDGDLSFVERMTSTITLWEIGA